MITKDEQTAFLKSLDWSLSVVDVYFWQGRLMVVNDYDIEKVEAFLDETGWARDIDFVAVNEFANAH